MNTLRVQSARQAIIEFLDNPDLLIPLNIRAALNTLLTATHPRRIPPLLTPKGTKPCA